jgi:flagellar motor switch protein FliG
MEVVFIFDDIIKVQDNVVKDILKKVDTGKMKNCDIINQ